MGASLIFGSFSYKEEIMPKVVEHDIIRFHVIAASDNPADQELKLRVRDEVLTYLYPRLKTVKRREEALNVIKNELPHINAVAQNYLKTQGKDIGIKVEMGKFYFSERSYGEYIVPAGYYDALRIKIGKAQGQNWWCILYPRLCFADWGRIEPSHVKSYYLKSLFFKKFKKTIKKG